MSKNLNGRSQLAAQETGMPAAFPHTRRWRRSDLDVPIRVIVRDSDKTKFHDGRGHGLSQGGMAVTAGAELKPGDYVAIEFTPAYTGIPIRVRGIVRNRAGYHYGVEFVTETEEETEQVNRLRLMLQIMSYS